MIKKTITYTDYNDIERTEDFYFNLTEAELTEMELETAGGLAAKVRRIAETKDVPEIIKVFKQIIHAAYGVKTPDGRGFKKSEEIFDDFAATPAYSILFMELATDSDAASAFINGVVPPKMRETAKV